MTPLRLYTAFHANLDFSALPDADRPIVIARCYWPLLSLPEKYGIRIGFEMSARTLLALEREDPEWVKHFRGLAERGLVELIASGWAQVVAPLAPVEVNRANLEQGNALYREMLGFAPDTFYVNEQTFSDGLVPLFAEAGARRVVMEWNNPAAAQPALRAMRCQPARFDGPVGRQPVLLWNDSIVFQKLQRYAHGVIPLTEVRSLLDRLADDPAAEALCIYGGDVEIFDYRPSRSILNPKASEDRECEIDRLIGLLVELDRDPRFEFVLPREVTRDDAILPTVQLCSPTDPIPCKKQPRYNPTRWAVSGRDGFGMNTRCNALLRSVRAARRFGTQDSCQDDYSDLVGLWRSDFRTRATEEKIDEFETGMGIASMKVRADLEKRVPALGEGEDLVIANPWNHDWQRMPIEIPLRLPVGRYFDLSVRALRGGEVTSGHSQLEVSGRHRDGSIRNATLVLEPEIAHGDVLGIRLEPKKPVDSSTSLETEIEHATSEAVEVQFLPHRGAAISSLRFPEISDMALLGTIPHGTFEEIAFTPDFFSGHVVAVTEIGEKHTDLRRVVLSRKTSESGPVRTSFEASIETPFGSWTKTFRLYRRLARLDVIHDLSFHEARLASLRLGTMTLLPSGWRRPGLSFGTVNGGATAEWHALGRGARLVQSAAVSSACSATSCLGATEGWVAFQDDEKGLLIQGDRSQAAVAAMLDFSEVDDDFFCRLTHSAAETDETRATFVRGKRRFGFSIEGYRRDLGDPFGNARLRHLGLVFRTETGAGLTKNF